MKFACDRCTAQYMISDEKVGPAGAKVRCKKCGHVIVVRRPAGDVAAPAPSAAPAPERGLDAELGDAFDTAFGDAPAKAPAAAPGAGADGGLDATQAMDGGDAARIAAAPAPAASEWYVAIGQAQVGPLPLAEVKRKWESGDVGPDSLVWRPGMGDWAKLTTMTDLAAWLAPVPRGSARGARPAGPEPRSEQARTPHPAAGPAPAGPGANAATGADVTWKPAGASALAALASEEISTRAPETRPAGAGRTAPAGARSLVESMDLPDGGGVDPTGAIPLPIKALEKTGEKKLTAVARGAEATRRKRTSRTVAVAAGVLLLGGAAAAGAFMLLPQRAVAPPPAAVAPTAAPGASTATPAAAAAPEVAAATAAEPAPASSASAPTPAAPVAAKAEPLAEAPPQPERPQVAVAKPTRAEPVRREPAREPARREPARVAQAPRREAPAAQANPTPPAPARKKDVLDFEANDAALEAALGGGGGGSSRSVYVPPPAGAAALPAKLSTDQINEAVLGRVDALRRCVSEQKTRDPDATGTLKMRWVVQGDGAVRDVKTLTPEYAQGQFAQCITGVVKSIRFPRSTTAGQEVTFPFRF